MKHRSDLARDSILSTVAGVFVSFTSFVSVVLIARFLGVEGAGLVAFAVWISFTGAIVANPGTSAALMRYLPELRLSGEGAADAFAASAMRWVGATLFMAVLVVLALSIWTPGAMSPAMWALIAGLMVLQGLAMNAGSYLKGMQRFDQFAIITIKSSALQLVTIVAGLALMGPSGALLGYIAGALLPAILAGRLMLRPSNMPQEFRASGFRKRVLWFAALNWGLAIISAVVWYRAELFFLQISHGAESVGLFATGLTLSNIATLFPALLLGALLPHFSDRVGRNEIEKLHATYGRVTRLIAALVFPVCFGLAAICPVLIPLLYGSGFALAIPSAMIVVAGSAIGVAVATNGNVIQSLERTHVLFISNIVGLVLMFIAGFTVIPTYGVEGAAISRVIVQFIIVAIEFWYVVFRLRIDVPVQALAKSLFAASVSALCAFGCIWLIGNLVSLMLAIPLGALVYFVMIRVLGALKNEDMVGLEVVILRLPAPVRGLLLRGVRLVFPTGG